MDAPLAHKSGMSVKATNVAAVILTAVMFVFMGCGEKKELVTDAVTDRDSIPMMTTFDVNSLVSDSGIVRYRIVAKEWKVFDKTDPPKWTFEKGIYVEKFDTLHHKEAIIQSDTAYYNSRDRIWTLQGNVHVESLKGERFDTQQLFWNEKTQKVYSDKYIKIVQPDRTIAGYGFDSNQQMTKYEIRDITGIFYVDESSKDTLSADSIKQ